MTKCIGGKFDGEHTSETLRYITMRKLAPAPALFEDYHPDMRPDSTASTSVIAQNYTLRTARCAGSEVDYYAPEEWPDEQAIRHALT
jgi:hypothetical protein